MIRILIYTDDKDEWFDKICNEVNIVHKYKTREKYWLESELFYFEILSKYPETCRGKRFSFSIIDKEIDKDTLIRINYATIQRQNETKNCKYLGELNGN